MVESSVIEVGVNTDNELNNDIYTLEQELNKSIGHFWWKSYINSAFWSNISTPINLIITILTALTTAETQTKEMFSESMMYRLSISTLLISTLNTFFRPSQQLALANESMNKWRELGNEFEKIELENGSKEKKTLQLKKLMEKVLDLRRIHRTSFLTDLIHLTSKAICIKQNSLWKPELNKN